MGLLCMNVRALWTSGALLERAPTSSSASRLAWRWLPVGFQANWMNCWEKFIHVFQASCCDYFLKAVYSGFVSRKMIIMTIQAKKHTANEFVIDSLSWRSFVILLQQRGIMFNWKTDREVVYRGISHLYKARIEFCWKCCFISVLSKSPQRHNDFLSSGMFASTRHWVQNQVNRFICSTGYLRLWLPISHNSPPNIVLHYIKQNISKYFPLFQHDIHL